MFSWNLWEKSFRRRDADGGAIDVENHGLADTEQIKGGPLCGLLAPPGEVYDSGLLVPGVCGPTCVLLWFNWYIYFDE
jgi:hypothetical protein